MSIARITRTVAALASCAFVAACGGGGHSVTPSAAAGGAGTGTLAFTIAVPGRGSTSVTKRLPKYVSAATAYAALVVTPQSGSPTTLTVPCTSVCTGSLSIPAGLANVQMTLEDASDNALSEGTTPVLIVADQTDNVRFTLDGLVSSVSLEFVPPYVTSATAATVFVLVNALDADGDVITYNGAYVDANDDQVVIKLSSTDPTVNAALASYAVSAPGAVIPVPYNGQAGITVTPSVTSGTVTGALAGAFLRVLGLLFVANSSTVTIYAPPYTGTPTTIASGVSSPDALALDGSGDLFVANGGSNTVTEYAPPYSSTTATITSGVSSPKKLVLDAAGDLFVANGGSSTVTEYAPPYSSTTATISSGVSDPDALALDGFGDLFVANGGSNTVTEYAPPYSSTTATITTGIDLPEGLALDGSGDLFVANYNAGTNGDVTEYPVSNYATGSPTTITNGVNLPLALALDPGGNLFVANGGSNVTEYPPTYYTGPPTTISSGIDNPSALALDAAGDLFVVNHGTALDVTIYAPPYSGSPIMPIGLSAPMAVLMETASGVANEQSVARSAR